MHEILTTICDKWALLIVYELSHGTKRHGELQRAIHGVSQKMLTQTLRKLERDRLVVRTVHPVVPPRVEYALTPLGETLTESMKALHRWTEDHVNGEDLTAARAELAAVLAMLDRAQFTYLCYTPEMPAEARDRAYAKGQQRFAAWRGAVARLLKASGRPVP